MRATLESSISLFNLFSVIVGLIALILAFFLLLTSTNANIRDNFWELGVLKAIGLDKGQCFRMLLYEAFATVISALVLGIGIGLLIAFTLTAQFYLFIELPIRLSVSIDNVKSIVPYNAFHRDDSTITGNNFCGSTYSCAHGSESETDLQYT